MIKTAVPQLVAHRGYLHRYPENTWRALEAALQAGACWLEFDIQMCRDGEFILLHDDSFDRTAGVDRSVFDTDSRQTDISVHEPRRFNDRFAPIPISTLVDVLHRLAAWPTARAMVEIKQESIDHWGLDTVMLKLVPLLAEHQPQCVLISYNRDALAWCRESYPAIQIGWVLQSYDAGHREQANRLKPDYLICNQVKLTDAQTPWYGQWQWMLYDIVDPDQALEWTARGVSLIETADIGAMLQDPRLQPGICNHGL
jgi:glycerophosphoryl diester phosphodiesterase